MNGIGIKMKVENCMNCGKPIEIKKFLTSDLLSNSTQQPNNLIFRLHITGALDADF